MRPGIPGSDRSEMLRQWPEAEARRLFDAKAEGMVKAGADVIAMEMMRDGDYSVWATEAAAATGLPVWVGIAVEEDDDGRLIGFGRPELAARRLRRAAVAICSGDGVGDALGAARHRARRWMSSVAIGAGRWVPTPSRATSRCPTGSSSTSSPRPSTSIWPSNGPRQFDLAMIGGCCGIGPSHIAALRAAFQVRLERQTAPEKMMSPVGLSTPPSGSTVTAHWVG